jgi:Zn-finger nucleic acid-binding protein
LKPETTGGVVIDRCERCQGLWFDGQEMEQVSDVAAKELRTPGDAMPSNLLCPRCGQRLYLFAYPQTSVAVAMCKQCEGVWVKADGYRALVRLREDLQASGGLEKYAPVGGFKGTVLRQVNAAISGLIDRLKH